MGHSHSKHSHSQTTDNVLSLCVVSSLADTLLDDFLLTYPVFMSTSDLCQALLGQYPSTHWKPLLPLTFIRNNLLLLSAKRAARRTQRHSCSADNTHTHTHLLFHLVCLMSANRASTCEMRKKEKALTCRPPTYCAKQRRAKEDGREPPERKRKVLHLVSQWMALCRDFLREDEHVKVFMKVKGGDDETPNQKKKNHNKTMKE